MMEKCAVRIIIVVGLVLSILTCTSACSYSTNSCSKNDEASGFHWVREESCFLDYTISKNTISFRYLFCFENNTEYDIYVSSLDADFSPKELDGWIEHECGTLYGDIEPKGSGITVRSGEKANIIVVFEGKYLGGEVTTDLSIPIHVVCVQRIVNTSRTEDGSLS